MKNQANKALYYIAQKAFLMLAQARKTCVHYGIHRCKQLLREVALCDALFFASKRKQSLNTFDRHVNLFNFRANWYQGTLKCISGCAKSLTTRHGSRFIDDWLICKSGGVVCKRLRFLVGKRRGGVQATELSTGRTNAK